MMHCAHRRHDRSLRRHPASTGYAPHALHEAHIVIAHQDVGVLLSGRLPDTPSPSDASETRLRLFVASCEICCRR